MKVDTPFGAPPLEPEELQQLKPAHITTQQELNQWEGKNILKAMSWILATNESVLSEGFIRKLHLKMFSDTWSWAGKFRKTNKNIGVDWPNVATELKKLLDDTQAQIEFDSYPTDEIAVRFHHRLVQIHCFPNGNGRHARIACDKLLQQLGTEKFSWGRSNLTDPSETRKQYIKALQAADQGDFTLLLKFVRS